MPSKTLPPFTAFQYRDSLSSPKRFSTIARRYQNYEESVEALRGSPLDSPRATSPISMRRGGDPQAAAFTPPLLLEELPSEATQPLSFRRTGAQPSTDLLSFDGLPPCYQKIFKIAQQPENEYSTKASSLVELIKNYFELVNQEVLHAQAVQHMLDKALKSGKVDEKQVMKARSAYLKMNGEKLKKFKTEREEILNAICTILTVSRQPSKPSANSPKAHRARGEQADEFQAVRPLIQKFLAALALTPGADISPPSIGSLQAELQEIISRRSQTVEEEGGDELQTLRPLLESFLNTEDYSSSSIEQLQAKLRPYIPQTQNILTMEDIAELRDSLATFSNEKALKKVHQDGAKLDLMLSWGIDQKKHPQLIKDYFNAQQALLDFMEEHHLLMHQAELTEEVVARFVELKTTYQTLHQRFLSMGLVGELINKRARFSNLASTGYQDLGPKIRMAEANNAALSVSQQEEDTSLGVPQTAPPVDQELQTVGASFFHNCISSPAHSEERSSSLAVTPSHNSDPSPSSSSVSAESIPTLVTSSPKKRAHLHAKGSQFSQVENKAAPDSSSAGPSLSYPHAVASGASSLLPRETATALSWQMYAALNPEKAAWEQLCEDLPFLSRQYNSLGRSDLVAARSEAKSNDYIQEPVMDEFFLAKGTQLFNTLGQPKGVAFTVEDFIEQLVGATQYLIRREKKIEKLKEAATFSPSRLQIAEQKTEKFKEKLLSHCRLLLEIFQRVDSWGKERVLRGMKKVLEPLMLALEPSVERTLTESWLSKLRQLEESMKVEDATAFLVQYLTPLAKYYTHIGGDLPTLRTLLEATAKKTVRQPSARSTEFLNIAQMMEEDSAFLMREEEEEMDRGASSSHLSSLRLPLTREGEKMLTEEGEAQKAPAARASASLAVDGDLEFLTKKYNEDGRPDEHGVIEFLLSPGTKLKDEQGQKIKTQGQGKGVTLEAFTVEAFLDGLFDAAHWLHQNPEDSQSLALEVAAIRNCQFLFQCRTEEIRQRAYMYLLNRKAMDSCQKFVQRGGVQSESVQTLGESLWGSIQTHSQSELAASVQGPSNAHSSGDASPPPALFEAAVPPVVDAEVTKSPVIPLAPRLQPVVPSAAPARLSFWPTRTVSREYLSVAQFKACVAEPFERMMAVWEEEFKRGLSLFKVEDSSNNAPNGGGGSVNKQEERAKYEEIARCTGNIQQCKYALLNLLWMDLQKKHNSKENGWSIEKIIKRIATFREKHPDLIYNNWIHSFFCRSRGDRLLTTIVDQLNRYSLHQCTPDEMTKAIQNTVDEIAPLPVSPPSLSPGK